MVKRKIKKEINNKTPSQKNTGKAIVVSLASVIVAYFLLKDFLSGLASVFGVNNFKIYFVIILIFLFVIGVGLATDMFNKSEAHKKIIDKK